MRSYLIIPTAVLACAISNSVLVNSQYFGTLLDELEGDSSEKVPCPTTPDWECISCYCDHLTGGFNICQPSKTGCPGLVTNSTGLHKKQPKSLCPYGETFIGRCLGCDYCKGYEPDHCRECFALPHRRKNQTDEINNMLPKLGENRFFNYAIYGWEASLD